MEQNNCRIVDFHSHILPDVDDGSVSVEMSLSMLRMEAEQGIGAVVATPHFYADRDTPDRFLSQREAAAAQLRAATDSSCPAIKLGAEVAYYPGMSESEALQDLCLEKSRYILVELPQQPWYNGIYEELAAISVRQGLTPIIAHVERYLAPLQTERILQKLESLQVLLQANAGFFLRKTTSRTALRLLRDGRLHFLGSDCHNLRDRPPRLGHAIREVERRLGAPALEWIGNHQRLVFPDD